MLFIGMPMYLVDEFILWFGTVVPSIQYGDETDFYFLTSFDTEYGEIDVWLN